jgi:hypothetical protein
MPSNIRNTDSLEQSTQPLGPDWDGDLKTRAPWLLKLGKRLKHHDSRFETHVKYGYHLDKHSGKTICRSTDHAKLIYNCALQTGTYAKPFNATAPVLLSGAASDAVPDAIATQYVPNPGRCDQIDSDILSFIVSTIISEKKGEDLEAKAAGSGVKALALLHAYAPIAEIKTWADGELATVRSTGFASADVPSLNKYRDDFALYNIQATAPYPDTVVCTDLLDQTRALGVHISGLLDYQLLKDSTDLTSVAAVVDTIETQATHSAGAD